MTVWTYVITDDTGIAPNHEAPATTLAICKPKIRRNAQPGDLVLAFNGSSLSHRPHSVRWAGRVSEVIPMVLYWFDSRFRDKRPDRSRTPDNIYCFTDKGWLQIANPFHTSQHQEQDLSGLNVLVFSQVWIFDGRKPDLPDGFGLRMEARRNHRRVELTAPELQHLETWLNANGLPPSRIHRRTPAVSGGCAGTPTSTSPTPRRTSRC